MTSIIHLIPQDGLGGVEQAARSTCYRGNNVIDICFMAGETLSKEPNFYCINKTKKLGSPLVYFATFNFLVKRKPDVLICSLWRSVLVGLLYYFFVLFFRRYRIKFIVFIHSANYSNLVDAAISKMGHFFSLEIWCDSESSRRKVSNFFYHKTRVISFWVPLTKVGKSGGGKNFIFWGRLNKVKQIEMAIEIFWHISRLYDDISFYIYGPDGGALSYLQAEVEELGLSEKVLFKGKKEADIMPDEIRECSFFFNTSHREGMGISVLEAMECGLIPIVTPVGEIPAYCKDGVNAIYVKDVESTARKVCSLIEDDGRIERLSTNAKKIFSKRVSYNEDFSANVDRVSTLSDL